MDLKQPILFINFKTYAESTGKNALILAQKAEQFLSKYSVVIVAQPTDIGILSKTKISIFAQHIDPVDFGSNTGAILPQAIKQAGAIGTVLNHAEKKLTNEVLEKSIKKAKQADLIVMACAENTERAKQIASFKIKPDFIAIEPPELIGGDVSVSTANPEIITDTIKEVHKISSIPVITGAGIKTSGDVKKAIELGTQGVFVASGIIKSENPQKAVQELLEGFD